MKTVVALVATIVTVTGYLINVPVSPISEPTLAPAGWVHMQKLMQPLFENVCEESDNPTIMRLSQEFMSTTTAAEFWDADCFTKLQQLESSNNLLARGEIFTEYNPEHVKELQIVFGVLNNAKTFDSFYKAASWARQNLNCGLYVDAIYLALENRRDTDKLTLPAPYELLPNYFIRKDIIIQGSSLLAGQAITPSTGVRDEGNAYTLDANYTTNINDDDDESKMAYYREDVALNSYYFLNMIKCAPWRNVDVDINSRYGEKMYFWMKQWMSRYNMERYSNGLAEIDGMGWDLIADIPYDPMLVYSNGNEFIHRSTQVNVEENEDKALLKTIETNLPIVVGHLRDGGYNKTQILNHLMTILVTSERNYDTLARRLLGKALSNNGNPSVLEHYLTSLRDPMFWKINKKIVDLVDNALKVLPPYNKNELYFPGVQVVSVDVKKMMTSFNYFEFDITDALKIGNGDTTFQVKIGQPRLSHKPFTMKINISSLVTQKGMVKIYLGPKVMPGEFSKNKNLFCLIDCFDINLKRGSNIVTRSSEDASRFSPDFESLRTLRKKVEDAEFGLDSLPLNSVSSQTQYPSRMVLPKGTSDGLPLQLLVFVAPYMKTSLAGTYLAANMEFNEAIMSEMYPLDLPIDDNMILGLPNLLLKDTTVTFKGTDNKASTGNNGYIRPSQPNAWEQFDAMMPIDNTYDVHQMAQNDAPVDGQALKFDYTSKKNGNYKSKRPYEKSEYSSYKKIDYKNINKDVLEPTDVPKVVPIEIPTIMPEDIEIINMPEIENMNNGDDGIHLVSFEMQNDSPVEKSKQPFQKSDYSYKKFDYKNIKKDIEIKQKNLPKKVPIDVPIEEPTGVATEKHVDIENTRDFTNAFDNKVDKIKTDPEGTVAKDVDSMEVFKVQVDDVNHELRVIPMLRLTIPKQQKFTIYDYMHSLGQYNDNTTQEYLSEEKENDKDMTKKTDGETVFVY